MTRAFYFAAIALGVILTIIFAWALWVTFGAILCAQGAVSECIA